MGFDANQAAGMRDYLLMKLGNEHKATMKVLDHLPDDKLGYTPHEKVKPFAEVSRHIYDVGHWFTAIMESGKAEFGDPGADKPPTPKSKAALKDMLNGSHENVVGRAQKLTGEQLSKEIQFANFGSFPAVTFLDWHISHLIHHRGQLTTYLRTMGAKVPAIYGDSADEPLNM